MNTAINYYDSNNPAINKESALKTKMTELVIPQTSNSDQIILPLVSSMTRSSMEVNARWLTWITYRKPSASVIKQFNPDCKHLRVIHINKHTDNKWIIWDALNCGNSHTVISDISSINEEEMVMMEEAALMGNCTGILIRSL